jgi:hypothetical protein
LNIFFFKMHISVFGLSGTGKTSFINTLFGVLKPNKYDWAPFCLHTSEPVRYTDLASQIKSGGQTTSGYSDLLSAKGDLPIYIQSITDYPEITPEYFKCFQKHMCDVIIYITTADFNESARREYDMLQKHVQQKREKGMYCKIIVVVTKCDTCDVEVSHIQKYTGARVYRWCSVKLMQICHFMYPDLNVFYAKCENAKHVERDICSYNENMQSPGNPDYLHFYIKKLGDTYNRRKMKCGVAHIKLWKCYSHDQCRVVISMIKSCKHYDINISCLLRNLETECQHEVKCHF